MTNDCKHENITLDDLRFGYTDQWFICPKCGERIYPGELRELGYKLVKGDEVKK